MTELNRRELVAMLGSLGIGTAVFQRALAAEAANDGRVTAQMVQQAEWIAGLELSDDEREATAKKLDTALDNYRKLRAFPVDYNVPPAIHFEASARQPEDHQPPIDHVVQLLDPSELKCPSKEEDLAFLPVSKLARLIKSQQVSSVDLTKLYLRRLKKYGPSLNCVVTLTEDLALEQARRADKEIAEGNYRGPLHGIPWGAKDLIAYPGYPTGWGATPFRDQIRDEKATVAQRLDQAGAVLVAKLSLGALAWGERWYGGQTRNPWNKRQGSSGSSAGSAAATAAGLVGFSLGSETMGSIISPSRRCGTTGLRPTFGRVSRQGCMSLAWSLDKIGPITRGVEDCALVLGAIHGSDGMDATAITRPFNWPCPRDLKNLRVGYVEKERARPELDVLRKLGVTLVPIRLPHHFPVWPMAMILNTEASAAFDELTRSGEMEGLERWPDVLRAGQFTPAVEYLRAQRIRTLLMEEMEKMIAGVDLYVGGGDLAITNFTGHPTVVCPAGFQKKSDGVEVPFAVTMTGKLFGESELLAMALAYQEATGFHLRRPPV